MYQQVIIDCGRICNINKDGATVCNSYHRQMNVSNGMMDGQDMRTMYNENEAVVFAAIQDENKQKKIVSVGSKNELELIEAVVESVERSSRAVILKTSTGQLIKAVINQTSRVATTNKFIKMNVKKGTRMSARVLPVQQSDNTLIAYSIKFSDVLPIDVAIDNEIIESRATHYTTQQSNDIVRNQIGVIVGYVDEDKKIFKVNNGISGDSIIKQCSISQYLTLGMFVRYDKINGVCENTHRVADIYPVQCSPNTVTLALPAVVLRCEHSTVSRYWLWNDLIGRIHVPAALNACLNPFDVVTAAVTFGRDRPDAQWTAINVSKSKVENERMTRISCSSQLMTADFTVTFKKSFDRVGFIQNPVYGSGYVSVQDMNNLRQIPDAGTRVRVTFVKQYRPNTHECKPVFVTPLRCDNTLVFDHPVYEQGILVSQPLVEYDNNVIIRTVITYQPSTSSTNSSPDTSSTNTPSSIHSSPSPPPISFLTCPSPSSSDYPIIIRAFEYLNISSFEQLRQFVRNGDNIYQLFEDNPQLYMDLYKVKSLSHSIIQH